ncbi:hypothetical protein CHS0354_028462 [Potamilus streckersoni]|uniref:Cilia- and flagella-associated protein 44 n=1 Tax=Potamilus streckersoni TaxID=2493646 RepID=A0AAE0SBT4_9BIVA|nr:hypothetical protein CHS0354_028462 [Potamilus streckersoni]
MDEEEKPVSPKPETADQEPEQVETAEQEPTETEQIQEKESVEAEITLEQQEEPQSEQSQVEVEPTVKESELVTDEGTEGAGVKEDQVEETHEKTEQETKDDQGGEGEKTGGEEQKPDVKEDGEQTAESKEAGGKETEGDTNQSAVEKEEHGEGEAGGGVEEEAERKIKEIPEEEKKIPTDFYYNFEDCVSRPLITTGSGLPEDLLVLEHSYGYDCTKRANLHLLDEKTLLFIAGNMVQLLDMQSREQRYIRSTGGGGIGALAVHPDRKFFAVAEKGDGPNINVFEWPSLKLYRILRGGTQKSYSYVDFSPDGKLLASQGGDPDYMLTLWDWQEEKTVLRSKAFSQDVFRVSFSTELEGQLTTSGTGHIRFWKMADTFTGLKLQGQLGKFGRTEISDIEGYVELPDGKVLSGTEWGNMLLWEGGLIKVEIQRKNKKSCHTGAIQQILLDEGELMTVGIDGYIRVWDFESIDTADTVDETGMFEMEPMNEMKVGQDVTLQGIVKSVDAENEPTIWYAQDGSGGIWRLDLSFSHTSSAPKKLFTYHAGSIAACEASPFTDLVATTGADHTVRVFDCLQKKQLCEVRYPSGGTSLLWASPVVDPKGGTLLVGFEDGVVRVFAVSKLTEGSSVVKKGKQDCDLELIQAFKPHNKKVTSLAIDARGDYLASGSEDGTIFFMKIGKTYEPIGFLEMPASVHQIQWSPDKFSRTNVLVFCSGGNVVEVDSPEYGKFDTSHSYKITRLPMRHFQFHSIKSRLRHEEELERKRLEEIERKKKEEEERRLRIERGLETESEHGEEEEKKQVEEEWVPYVPAEPSPILAGFYSEEGKFWLSVGGFDAGYLYECKFWSDEERAKLPPGAVEEPHRAIPILDSKDTPISMIKFSKNGRQALFGMENGVIRIQNLEATDDISKLGPYWQFNVHDNDYGNITGLVQSHDGKRLISVGADGNFFIFTYMEQERLEKKIAEAKATLPSAKKKESEKIADDIDDPNAYSIEDAKQKAEYDKMMKDAEEKKREVRRQVAKLRRQFKTLLEQNDGLPKHLQLHKDEFELDKEIKEELRRQREEKIELVRKELAWESEKQRIALEKLRKRYKDVVECERIVLKAFRSPHEVCSFRAAKLSDDFYSLKAEFERRKTMISKDDMTRDPTRDLLTGQTRMTESTALVGDKQEDAAGAKVLTTLKGSMGERITKALNKVEEKKKKRAARKAQWEELFETKPDDGYEDPADVAAIKEAKENMGDFKLKTAKDYVVPDHLRMNVDKARGRLLIIKDLIHEYKYNFNLRFLALRDKKIHVIEEIRDLVAQLEEVQSKLSPDKHKPIPDVPEMYPDEMPEKKLEYTRESLLTFKKEMKEKKASVAKGDDSGGFGGFGGFGGAEKQAAKQEPALSASPPPVQKQSTTISQPLTGEAAKETETVEDEELSPLELQIKQMEEIRLSYEQDRLLKTIDELLQNFDAELHLLRHDKFKLDIVMKNADLRQVTLFEELVLLKEYEKREDVLAAKVTNKQQEKLDMQAKIVDVQSKLELKKKDIEKFQDKERALHAQFVSSLGENNKFAEYLTKVFKKRIKRSKKKATEGEGSDEESESDDEDESDWDEDEDEDEEEQGGFDLDICPPGCDQNLYDATCQLREKRLDIEEALAEEKKTNEALKKELESLTKKAKVIDTALKTAQNDLEAFQLEKQQKLNDLDVVVSLKLHQIQYMVNGVLPQDLSQTLIFDSSGVVRLQGRIKELQQEKHLQKKQMKESKKTHVQLIKDRKIFEQKIREMETECDEMLISKFGRIVDLEKLETVTVNRTIEELKEKLRMTEMQCSEELLLWDEKLSEKKIRITELIKENTKRLNHLSTLVTEKKKFEQSLDSRQKNLGEEYSGRRKSDIHERQRLIQLVQLQAQEIDALKEEIMLLSRKGGHILPPAQPPLPQSPANMRTISQ